MRDPQLLTVLSLLSHLRTILNSNPFVVVNLNNKIKKCGGCPFPFRDEQGPVFLEVAVKHVEKDVYFDKASGTQRVTKEGNRYYHCQVSCITSRHPYFSPAMLRADPDLLLDDSKDIV